MAFCVARGGKLYTGVIRETRHRDKGDLHPVDESKVMNHGFTINSYWGPRAETPARIAARCRNLLERLAAISPIFTGWTYVGRKNPPPIRRYEGPDALDEYFRDQYRTIALGELSETE